MYKKSRWMKIKEVIALYYSNIKRSFAKLLYKINEKGSQRLTIMVVPHSEKKIMNIQISNYILFSFSVLLGITIGASVLAIGQTNHNQKQYDFLIRDDDLKQRQIEDFKTQIESFDKRFTSLKVDITNIIRSVGKDKNVYNYDNIEIPDNDSTNSTARQTKILNKLKNDLEVTKVNVVRIGKCIEEWEGLLDSIPSKYPLPERVAITSPFGLRVDPVFTWRTEFHPGVDLAAFPGTPILAAANGEVISAGWLGGYGLQVEIRHKYGFSTRYAHMEEIGPGVVPGAQIRQGQVVGYVGMTGKVTGPHLHFEVLIGESQIDPVPFTTMMQ
jgi:murein DD-endopeptidase MepM/ murein hydrolase activator NlpD